MLPLNRLMLELTAWLVDSCHCVVVGEEDVVQRNSAITFLSTIKNVFLLIELKRAAKISSRVWGNCGSIDLRPKLLYSCRNHVAFQG